MSLDKEKSKTMRGRPRKSLSLDKYSRTQRYRITKSERGKLLKQRNSIIEREGKKGKNSKQIRKTLIRDMGKSTQIELGELFIEIHKVPSTRAIRDKLTKMGISAKDLKKKTATKKYNELTLKQKKWYDNWDSWSKEDQADINGFEKELSDIRKSKNAPHMKRERDLIIEKKHRIEKSLMTRKRQMRDFLDDPEEFKIYYEKIKI